MTININDRVKEVLERGYLMSLGTVNAEGVWVSDVVYFTDKDMNVYWMSDPDTRHSRAIEKNGKVAATITVSNKGEKNFGIQLEGHAEKVEGARHDLAVLFAEKKGKPAPKEGADILKGDSWYKLMPTRIFLIDEANFGFDRQTLKT